MSMVEIMARAFLNSVSKGERSWDDLDLITRGGIKRDVRAVLEAMREPTDAMLTAGERECDECLDQAWPTGEHANADFALDAPKMVWQSMITAALKEG